jgi:hypothetical protein
MKDNPEHISEIYGEYLERLKVDHQLGFFYCSSIPQPPIEEYMGVQYPVLLQDQALSMRLQKVQRELMNQSTWTEIKNGLRIISENGAAASTAVTASVVSLLIFAHSVNYSLGIFWSAQQAVIDYKHGEIPSIAGHSLEWSAELLGLASFVWYYAGEIASVGRVRLIQQIFDEHTPDLEEGQKDLIDRYHDIMKDQIRAIPSGIFFNVPKWLMYEEKPKENHNE